MGTTTYFPLFSFQKKKLLFKLYLLLIEIIITQKKFSLKKIKIFQSNHKILINLRTLFPICCRRNFVFVLTFAQKAIKNASKQKSEEYFYVRK